MADENKPQNSGLVMSLSNLDITHEQLDPDYDLIKHDLKRGETGLLSAFSLIAKISGKPSFRARMDDGSDRRRKDPELDLDIEGVTDEVKTWFKQGRNDYYGHHTLRQSDNPRRTFDVEIGTPAGIVFKGEVSFAANFVLKTAPAMIGVGGMSVNARVTRAADKGCVDGSSADGDISAAFRFRNLIASRTRNCRFRVSRPSPPPPCKPKGCVISNVSGGRDFSTHLAKLLLTCFR
jgi:hypothetical protein